MATSEMDYMNRGGGLLNITPNANITSNVKATAVVGTCFAYGTFTTNAQVAAGAVLFSGLKPPSSSTTVVHAITYPTTGSSVTAVRNITINTNGEAVIPTGGDIASGNTWLFAIGYDYD